MHVAELVLALVIVPIATELPETLNSVLWVRTNDDMLAFGNVAGSATFQSCVLATIGVVFTTWSLGFGGRHQRHAHASRPPLTCSHCSGAVRRAVRC